MLVEIILGLIAIILLIVVLLPNNDIDIRWKTIRAISKLPGPPGIPLLGKAFLVALLPDKELFNQLNAYCKRYPRIMATYVAGIPFVVLQEPQDLEILLGSVNYIKKGYEYFSLKPWLREGLLLSWGEKWQQRRKLLTPAFHFRILEDNLESLNKHARHLVKNILNKDGKRFILNQLVTLCTLDVICETAMGFSLKTQDNRGSDYVDAVKMISTAVVTRLRKFWLRRDWLFHLTKLGRQFNKNLALLHGFTEKVIKERKISYKSESNESEQQEDSEFLTKRRKAFLDSLLELDKKYPNFITDLDIREEVDTFMFEGHDTTSAAIVFAIFLLGTHPEIQEKAYQEQYRIFEDSDRAATNKDLHEMNYLEMIIKETLRLYPSVPYISRVISKDLKLRDNVIIPENANVVVLPVILHRDPRYFTDPDVFDPERFTPENCKKRHPYAYIPFSAGPRNCIGQKFAMMELKVVLSTVIRFLKIIPVTKKEDFLAFPFLIIRVDPPIQIKAILRNDNFKEKFISCQS